jgi:UPF0755 protein
MYIKKILLAIIFIGLAIAAYFAYFVYGAMLSPNTNFEKPQVYVTFPSGSTYNQVKTILQPYLKDVDAFDALASKKKYTHNVKAGRYIIKKDMSNNDIINSIRSNNIPIKIAFNNQETLERLAGRIASQIETDSLSLLEAFKDETFLGKNKFTKATALSMYIPNSYEFFWNTSADKFRNKMLVEYNRFWNSNRVAKAQKIGLSPEEVITLASIVQKETAKVDERPRVAGVYLNRLNIKMPLQADPTVIYAIREKANDFDKVIKRVLFKDLEIDSPYNTYKYPGLPPGPIAMPDISAIDAVLNYEKHKYFYFVANVKNFGYHKFAKTLAQHNRNRQEYVRWINKQGINR